MNWGHYQRNFSNFEKYQSKLTNFFGEQKMFVDLTLSLFQLLGFHLEVP